VIKLADYAWRQRCWKYTISRAVTGAMFVLSKEFIRKGGTIKPRDPSAKYPKLRLAIETLKRPNQHLQPTPR